MNCDIKDVMDIFDKIGDKAVQKNELLAEIKGEFNVTDADAANALIEALQANLLTINDLGFLRRP